VTPPNKPRQQCRGFFCLSLAQAGPGRAARIRQDRSGPGPRPRAWAGRALGRSIIPGRLDARLEPGLCPGPRRAEPRTKYGGPGLGCARQCIFLRPNLTNFIQLILSRPGTGRGEDEDMRYQRLGRLRPDRQKKPPGVGAARVLDPTYRGCRPAVIPRLCTGTSSSIVGSGGLYNAI